MDISYLHPQRSSVKYSVSLLALPKNSTFSSMVIQDSTYYRVLYFRNSYDSAWKLGCFYQNQTGILKLEIADNETLELITKK